ncbi:MAG: DUF2933 domain-containing protein [Hydrogenophilales bacterium]|nr:DUF2933 domain-containing protein [Hydrogenophilales bacterium]
MAMNGHRHSTPPMSLRTKLAWFGFAAVAAFYLWTEHRAHLLGALPLLLLLPCPLMHLFGHGGHGHGGKGGDQ